eukprot:1161332-Pelagomonas_calceolata.AAC.10
MEKSLVHQKRRDYRSACKELQVAVKLDPHNQLAWNMLGLCRCVHMCKCAGMENAEAARCVQVCADVCRITAPAVCLLVLVARVVVMPVLFADHFATSKPAVLSDHVVRAVFLLVPPCTRKTPFASISHIMLHQPYVVYSADLIDLADHPAS